MSVYFDILTKQKDRDNYAPSESQPWRCDDKEKQLETDAGSEATLIDNFNVNYVVLLCLFLVRGMDRKFAALISILLFYFSHTPFEWPTYIVALVPLIWIWRESPNIPGYPRCLVEAVVIGFSMSWLITGFVEPAVPPWGAILHGAGCLLFSLQMVAIALIIRLTSSWRILYAVAPIALVAVAAEITQAYLGLTWATTNPSLAIASTPLAQWSGTLTPFGLSAALYLVNFLWFPDWKKQGVQRWGSTIIAGCLAGTLWLGGIFIESQVVVQPLTFSTMLVQAHLHQANKYGAWMPWQVLHPLTVQSLQRDGPVDLIVWPETCLKDTHYDTLSEDEIAAANPEIDLQRPLTLAGFRDQLSSQYGCNCLVGVPMLDNAMATRFGYRVPEIQHYNCGCLVSKMAEVDCHEKVVLVPLRESLPTWIRTDFVRGTLLPFFELTALYSSGRNFHLLTFEDSTGTVRTIAAAVCYESWHPWLPQFHQAEPLDAIVYMMYDGDFVDHPELIQRQLLSVRLRAIETRTWNLVCSTWRGTAIIDPRGRIVKELPPVAGVLRTDEL